jgi:uncharacterized protein YdhG (YjbR/CyaY superfamily)
MKRNLNSVDSIDGYLKGVPADRRRALECLRRTIRSIIPEAEECLSYRIPAFRVNGVVVAGFCATTKGCSYFPFSGSTLRTLGPLVSRYEQTKSSLHFSPEIPLPLTLVRKLIKTRMAETKKQTIPNRDRANKA